MTVYFNWLFCHLPVFGFGSESRHWSEK